MSSNRKNWSAKHNKCIKCGTTSNKHCAKGMCNHCYEINRWKENPEKQRKRHEKYRELNIGKIRKKDKETAREKRIENPEKIKENQKNWRKANPEKIKGYAKKWRIKNPEKVKKFNKEWRENNPEKIIDSIKRLEIWAKENPEKVKEKRRINRLNKYHNDIHFRLRSNISRLINLRLKKRLSSKNSKSTWSFLPYTVEEFIKHIESQFTDNMTWKNYGKWHIDHKIPDSKFNYKNVGDKEFQECWALENLQPLWAIDNWRKNNKY